MTEHYYWIINRYLAIYSIWGKHMENNATINIYDVFTTHRKKVFYILIRAMKPGKRFKNFLLENVFESFKRFILVTKVFKAMLMAFYENIINIHGHC